MAEPQEAKAESSCHVSFRRYTRSEIKFYYYPTSRALGGGLMYQDDGTPTYCIWWSGSTVIDNTLNIQNLESVVTNEECLDGLYTIMQNGYDGGTNYSVGGVNLASYGSDAEEREELAYYATSWAIHLWMARYGYERTTLVQKTANAMTWDTSSLKSYAVNGKVSNATMGAGTSNLSKAAWRAAMELLVLAVEGEDQTATASISLKSQTTVGNYHEIILEIQTTNATGWALTYSTLPEGASVSKTGGTGSLETVIVKIPISAATATYQFTATPSGIGCYVTDSYRYFTGSGEQQSLVSWKADFTSTGNSGSVQVHTLNAPTASLSLKKVDNSTGDARSGAEFTIQEQVTVNGISKWYDVGTLKEGSTTGTYDQIFLAQYYDSSGTPHTYSAAKTTLVRTQYNSGKFRIKETTAPTGYEVQTGWSWYVTVVSEGSWSSISPGVILGGSTAGTYVIGKTSSSSATTWHYVKSGSTAYYSNYAGYDDTTNTNYNYANSLGNTGGDISASLTKVDNDTGEVITGAVFSISELVGGNWYEVGTLTDDDGDGVYTDISITCHFNSSGERKACATQTTLVYTDANTGRYRITEKTAPPGHEAQAGWAWYLKAVPDAQWNSGASSPNSMYQSLYADSYVEIGYPAASSKAVWTYVLFGNIADYATAAENDTSGNAIYNLGTSLGNTGESSGLSLNKVDASTGDPLSGAVFTIYEQVGDDWYEVGTLTEGSVDGTYKVVEITKHYDSNGEEKTLDQSDYEDTLVYTNANGGKYMVKETMPPEGYEIQENWQWCIVVSPSVSWSSVKPNTILGGSTSESYIIGKNSASSDTAWHYVKAGSTAYYSHYATYDDTQNALFNYGTKLGNSPSGIDVTLTKMDYITNTKLTGAVFSIEEKVNDSWCEVGTLTESEDSSGVYDVIEITTHYDTNGKPTTLTETQTQLTYTEANGGEYRIKEKESPDNFEISENWCWYITVVRSSAWPSGEDTTGLEGTLLVSGSRYGSDTWKVMKVSDTKAVQYVVQSGTANYHYYAMYDVNTDNTLVANSYTSYNLGNLGISANLSLNKIDYNSEEPLSGITFEIQEYAGGSWYTVGTLSESEDTAGTYDVVSITQHYYYASNGRLVSKRLTQTEDVLRYTSANGGLYRVVETAVPDGYQLAEDWAWYVQVVSESTYEDADDYGDILGEDSTEGYRIVGVDGTAFAVYCASDNSLTFYYGDTVPTVNSTYEGKTVTAVYTGFETIAYTAGGAPWYEYAESITKVTVADTEIMPQSTAYWFYYFTNCTEMDLAKLDTSNVTSMYMMFISCQSLTSLDVSSFDTSNVTTMQSMFQNCYALTSITGLTSFDTSKVTAMNSMFRDCQSLTSLNLSSFDTANVTAMQNMFRGCSSLKTITGLTSFATAKVTNMGAMFYGCESLTSLNVSSFDTARVTAMNAMFYNCSSLKSITGLTGFDTSNVTTMNGMFGSCSALTSLDLSSFDTSKVKNMTSMFGGCTSLATIYVSNLWTTSVVEEGTDMFWSCYALEGSNGTAYSPDHTTYTYARIDRAPSLPGYFTYKAAASTTSLETEISVADIVNDARQILNAAMETDETEETISETEHTSVEETTMETEVMSVEETTTENETVSAEETTVGTEATSAEETIVGTEATSAGETAVGTETMSVGETTVETETAGVEEVIEKTGATDAEGTSPEFQMDAKETTLVEASASNSGGTYAMVIHFVRTGETAYYTDYAKYDTTEENIAYNYELSDGEWVLANSLLEIKLQLIKFGENHVPLAGAEFTIQELVGDTWYNIGTLTSSANNYMYDTVNITCHYDENGEKIELTNAEAGLVLLATNSGTYRVIETKAPDGYYCPTPDEWSWDLTVTETMLINQATQSMTMTETKLNDYAVTVYKLWDDDDDYAGKRPNSVTVTLLQNGKTYGSPVTLSDANGWSYSWTGLPTGCTYTITETATADYTATTTYTESSMQRVYTLTNTYKPKTTEVTVVKKWEDDDDTAEMRPTSIKVALYADGVKMDNYDSVTLSADTGWTYTWSDLYYYREGSTSEKITYTVAEEEVTGYVQTKTSTTDSNGNLTITMTNTITKIPFLKVDASGKAISGVTLRIVDSKENTVENWATDGTAHVIYGLEPGTYTLTETSTPAGYLRAASISFTVGEDGKLSDGSTTITMTDENTSVKLLKTDAETGKALAGAKLSVTNAETGDEILSWVSGDSSTKASSISISSSYPNVRATAQTDGSILVTCLPTGEYILTESEAPDGYKVVANVVFTVTKTSTTQSITVEDERYRELQILKTDADGNAVLGATLGLYKGSLTVADADALVETWVTDGTAHVLEDIEAGTYTVFELYTPAGYVTADPVTVTITKDSETMAVTMKDEPIVVTLLKTDKETGDALAGATLMVTDAAGNAVVTFVSGDSSTKASSITIGDTYENRITAAAQSDGSLKITYLPTGDYTLTEIKTPSGYVTAESVSFTITEKKETQSVTMEDDRIKVQISKTDLTNGEDVANAVLTVTDSSGNTVLTWTTREVLNGYAPITFVSVGSVYKDKFSTAAVVNEGGNWAIQIDCLPAGTYTLSEVSVPDGYVKSESVSFTVEETGNIQKANMKDDVTKISLYKIEKGTLVSETGEDGTISYSYTAVAGATLALKDSAENLIVRFTSGDTVTKAVISEIGTTYQGQIYTEVTADGGVVIYRLPAGTTCTLTEETTPAGYIAGTSVKFTTTDSADMAYVFMENDYTKLAVWKVDAETKEELPGAQLQILDEDGNVVAEWISGSEQFVLDEDGNEILVDSEGNVLTELTQETNADGTVTIYDASGNVVTDVIRLSEYVAAGEPHEIDRLAAGTYTLHEVSAPEDYNIAQDIRFQIAEDGTVISLTDGVSVTLTDGVYTITMEDTTGHDTCIFISKVDENKKPLSGAVLAFYEGDVTEALAKGDETALAAALVDRWTTNGTDHQIDSVQEGTYTIVEESAPDGYALAAAMVITVDGSKDAYYFTIVNTPEMDMPSTGGAGLVPTVAFAGMTVCALGVALLLRKRQDRDMTAKL